MRLSDVERHIRSLALGRRWPQRETIRSLRDAVSAALRHEEFLVDCIDREIACRPARPAGATLRPFSVVDEQGARLALAYWAPGRSAGAHEHAAWTVTAVAHNQLAVETFDFAAARDEGRLERRNVFVAEAGRAGQIDAPCVHNPYNPTPRWSVSIHVFSAQDDPQLRLPQPAAAMAPESVVAWEKERSFQQLLRVDAGLLGATRSARAPALLASLYASGDDSTKRRVARAMSSFDAARAAQWSQELSARDVVAGTRLSRAWPEALLAIEETPSAVEVVAHVESFRRVLLRASTCAAEALGFVVANRELEVSELPGILTTDERIALCRGLVEAGILAVAAS